MGTKLAQQQPDPFDQATWEILIHTAWNHAGFLYKSAEPLPGAGVGQAPSQWPGSNWTRKRMKGDPMHGERLSARYYSRARSEQAAAAPCCVYGAWQS